MRRFEQAVWAQINVISWSYVTKMQVSADPVAASILAQQSPARAAKKLQNTRRYDQPGKS
jgi:hypothetical protein